MSKKILITGGAGFIGSHVVRYFVKKYPDYHIFNIDKLTYAGNLENLKDIKITPNYTFLKIDITDASVISQLFQEHAFDYIIHLAAESHVDRSIICPNDFVMTNVVGTVNLLNAARYCWTDQAQEHCFYHISTDEVYGSLANTSYFTENTRYNPRSPYSASKAASDHFVSAYFHTYNIPIVISNCSNNFGSHQFPEKLIPLIIHNIREKKTLPIYGKGDNIRDWLWVEDHVRAIDAILFNGKRGETYNIGGNNEWKNIDLVKLLCSIVDKKLGRSPGESEKLIVFVKDRAGHDLRYAIDASKITNELGWKPLLPFEITLEKTVEWYLENQQWLDRITSGDYLKYYENQYLKR